jgi:predicted ATPase/DNA-binding CsgD family transcriptional regulator
MAAAPESKRSAGPRSGTAGAKRPPAWVGRRPVPLTAIVGREREAAALRNLLSGRAARLVTLTGPGGVGKTRLAVEVASTLEVGFDTVAFVPLAPVGDAGLLAVTIAQTVGLEVSDETATSALTAYMRTGTLLLILDSVEHLPAAGPLLVELLGAAPGLTVLATSRASLRVSGEQLFPVPPLTLPDPGPLPPVAILNRFGAVRLFVDRARAVRPGFVVDDQNAGEVVEICRRLDGLPLAIELAAARASIFPPRALLGRLARRLELLTEGAHDQPERLRSLRAGIAWSYDLLSADEQRLFRRLAVFAGGCTLAAAEVVDPGGASATLDLVSALVDRSLLQPVTAGGAEPRFAMLETIREYAMERLEASGEALVARRAHAGWFRSLAEHAEPGLRGPDQQHWRDILEADLDNLRAALAWTLDAADPEDADQGVAIVGALWYFWFQRGLTGEARRWLALALARAPQGRARAQVLLGAGTLAWRQGDLAAARTLLEESAALWRDHHDRGGLAEATHVLGHVRFDQRDHLAARGLFEESLQEYRRAADTIGGLPLLGDLGLVAYHEGANATADGILRESLALYREHGLKDRVAGALNVLGDLAQLAGDHEQATARYEESLALWGELRGTPGIASALHKLGQVSRSTDDVVTARARLAESLALQQELGNRQGIAECLAGLAGTAAAAGHPERAARLLAASSALLEEIGVPLAPVDRAAFARDLDATRKRLGAAWERTWAEGLALSADKAIALALTGDDAPPADAARREAGVDRLSPREREVSRLIAQGLTNRQIARALAITEKTVGSHVDHIMTKLDLRSRTRIAVWATQHGLGPSRPG